jgi:hypothetical protein
MAGDEERRVNLRLAVRARPYNGYTYVKGYLAVTCETLTVLGWRRYPCSLEWTQLSVGGGVFEGGLWVHTENSGADGFYSAYTRWVRTACPTTVDAVAMGEHGGEVFVGLYYRHFQVHGDDGFEPASDPYTLTCS